ncbi:MAG: hypothetical protein ACUVS4_12955 [Chloroflexaceae bacterium]
MGKPAFPLCQVVAYAIPMTHVVFHMQVGKNADCQAMAHAIPMTHGLAGFQDVMLPGIAPHPRTWIGLSLIAVITLPSSCRSLAGDP